MSSRSSHCVSSNKATPTAGVGGGSGGEAVPASTASFRDDGKPPHMQQQQQKSVPKMVVVKEMMAAGPGCAIANGLLNGFETTKVKLQLLHNANSNSSQRAMQRPHAHPQHYPSHPPPPPHHHHHLATTTTTSRPITTLTNNLTFKHQRPPPHFPTRTMGTTPTACVYPNATMTGVMTQIAREEGLVRGLLTPGLDASLTRSMLYGAYRVGLYPTVREMVVASTTTTTTTTTNNGNHTRSSSSTSSTTTSQELVLIQQRILSGMITGGLGSMISCPLDVVRTRLQADAGLIRRGVPAGAAATAAGAATVAHQPTLTLATTGTATGLTSLSSSSSSLQEYYYVTGLRRGQPVRYRGMISALMTIWKEEGLVKGLYRGASVTIARACVLNGAQLASYDTAKQYALKMSYENELNNNNKHGASAAAADSTGVSGWTRWFHTEGPALHIMCALWSGVLAQTVIMPMDTIKSHMMLGKGWKHVVSHMESLLWSGGITASSQTTRSYNIVVNRNMTTFRPQRVFRWLYRGYLPACAGQGLIMVLQMPLIESFRKQLGVQAI